jgi:hypothetical protein
MKTVLSFLVVALLSTTTVAFASDIPGRWKLIAGDGSIATSNCIGTYETVDCLADSIAACSAWSEHYGFMLRGEPDLFPKPHPLPPPRADLCLEIPGYVDGGPFFASGPKDTVLHLYKTDRWTLERPTDWNPHPHLNPAEAGDIVLDFEALSCSPDPACLRNVDPFAPADEILARCPRTYCEDTLDVDEGRDASGQVVSYEQPIVSFLVRQIGDEWRVIAWYRGGYNGFGGKNWIADHWKR